MMSMNVAIHIVDFVFFIIIPNYYIFGVSHNGILSINAIHIICAIVVKYLSQLCHWKVFVV